MFDRASWIDGIVTVVCASAFVAACAAFNWSGDTVGGVLVLVILVNGLTAEFLRSRWLASHPDERSKVA